MKWDQIEIVDNNDKIHKGNAAKKFVETNCPDSEIRTLKEGKIVVGAKKNASAKPEDVRRHLEQKLLGKAKSLKVSTGVKPTVTNFPVARAVPNVINIIPPANTLQMFLDENRDGVMDLIPAAQANWTWGAGPVGQGAILLVNTKNHLVGQNVSARAEIMFRWLNDTNDAVGAAWTATLTVSHPPRVRIFTSQLKVAADANLLNIAAPLDLKSPLIQPIYSPADGRFSLWIEAAAFPASAVEANWRVRLTFDFVNTNGAASQQICELRIAPWIMASDLDPTATVLAVQNPAGNPPPNPSLQHSIQAFANPVATNLRQPVLNMAGRLTKPFLRDVMKAGYLHAPHYQEIAVMRGLDSGSDYRGLGAIPPAGSIRPMFNGTQIVAEGMLGGQDQPSTSQDNGGNLLVTPPIAGFPHGRILYGRAIGFECRMRDFFDHQQVQAPFFVDSSWLNVGHVDEFISFLPDAANVGGWPWKILLLSPRLGYAIAWLASVRNNIAAGAIPQLFLDAEADAQASFLANENFAQLNVRLANHGGLVPIGGGPPPGAGAYLGDPLPPLGQNGKMIRWNNNNYDAQSLDAYLNDPGHAAKFNLAQPAIDTARATLLARLGGLPQDRILEIPTLLNTQLLNVVTDNADSVNMLVLKDAQTRVLVPHPFGPVCADTYLFRRYIEHKVGPLVNAITFANDWDDFHVHEGEIHCGTNQIPQPLAPARAWWLHPPAVAP